MSTRTFIDELRLMLHEANDQLQALNEQRTRLEQQIADVTSTSAAIELVLSRAIQRHERLRGAISDMGVMHITPPYSTVPAVPVPHTNGKVNDPAELREAIRLIVEQHGQISLDDLQTELQHLGLPATEPRHLRYVAMAMCNSQDLAMKDNILYWRNHAPSAALSRRKRKVLQMQPEDMTS